ncbi:MAG: IPT/TIG domain-containing protein [Treponema sp.]|nr:IPT/TIG domain-containing protein [Treponema sp.]
MFRFGVIVLSVFAVIGVITLATFQARKIPSITSITPQFGSPGDIMIINGKNFGSTRSSGYVEIGGSRVTASSYLQWQDDRIRLILPTNVQDGLVIVGTKAGRSRVNSFFANESGIPVEVPVNLRSLAPSIASVSPASVTTGSLVTITGFNFGSARNSSLVYFSTQREAVNLTENIDEGSSDSVNPFEHVCARAENFDYEVWSDTEIQLRVPDGAESGVLFVKTENGLSNQFAIDVKNPAGTKTYQNLRSYVIQMNADVENINSRQNSSLVLRVPVPYESSRQPYYEVTECLPEPAMKNYDNTICHLIDLSRSSAKKMRFTHKFVVYSYGVNTSVNEKNVKPYTEKNRALYVHALAPDMLIKCNDDDVVNLVQDIVKNETNPYVKARLIYNYMTEKIEVTEKLRDAKENPMSIFSKGKGDAYDFALAYTTLLRAAKIPALPVSGILVSADKNSRNHWWTEFYIENFGWIPADTALGAGMEYRGFGNVADPKKFYFGNLDGQHIEFSRGSRDLRPVLSNAGNVYRPKTYALQSIWEESSSGNVNYSSLWNDPVVLGIY